LVASIPQQSREQLIAWLVANKIGAKRFRAAL
jgi:hypothetical protein